MLGLHFRVAVTLLLGGADAEFNEGRAVSESG
jgi:hypothetical protein